MSSRVQFHRVMSNFLVLLMLAEFEFLSVLQTSEFKTLCKFIPIMHYFLQQDKHLLVD